ncbi:sigma-70 family RNA polymerase sigma factor [Streptomyces sp. NPDC051018]|uniref:sigma-70 family RNA polymerase sigma factor n=1 Tax=Streptomyces sp. NPDC051018 TaxID=3365639 RepID=UPI00379E21D7
MTQLRSDDDDTAYATGPTGTTGADDTTDATSTTNPTGTTSTTSTTSQTGITGPTSATDPTHTPGATGPPRTATPENALLAAARQGDSAAFEALVKVHRRELYAHCYRMLGSVQDAEDALQESLLGAWRGLSGFEGRSSLRAWLYRICTNACLRLAAHRPRRMLSPDHGPPRRNTADLGEPVTGPVWLEPWPDEGPAPEPEDQPAGAGDPEARWLRRESVELAFVAALQHLPGTQRAVLILREVLQFSAAETARILDTTPASVNSALQRARRTVAPLTPKTTQRAELEALGEDGRRELVDAFMTAWERADVSALLRLLTEDARFGMPPLPAWFDGREDVVRFFTERVFATPWRLMPLRANGQPGFACYLREPGSPAYRIGAINVLTVRSGRIAEITGFLDPELHRRLGLPPEHPAPARRER